jgi:hypothetical protein
MQSLKTNNLSLCLNCEYLKSVLQKKYFWMIRENYIGSRCCWSKFNQNGPRIDFGIMLKKCGFIWNISKTFTVTEYCLHVTVQQQGSEYLT